MSVRWLWFCDAGRRVARQRTCGFTASDQPRTLRLAAVGTWVNIGPAPLSYAHNPADPVNFNSGRVAAIAVDPSNAYHWLIGVGNGGVWESMDGGTSWLPIADSAPTLAIGSIAFAPSNPRVIYVGTGESAGVGFTRTGVGVLEVDGWRPDLGRAGRLELRPRGRAANARASDQRQRGNRGDHARRVRQGIVWRTFRRRRCSASRSRSTAA